MHADEVEPRHADDQHAARPQRRLRRAQHGQRLGDVLDDMVQHDDVERRVAGDRHQLAMPGKGGALRRLDAERAPAEILESVEQFAGAAADVEHAAPGARPRDVKRRLHWLEQFADIGRRGTPGQLRLVLTRLPPVPRRGIEPVELVLRRQRAGEDQAAAPAAADEADTAAIGAPVQFQRLE